MPHKMITILGVTLLGVKKKKKLKHIMKITFVELNQAKTKLESIPELQLHADSNETDKL